MNDTRIIVGALEALRMEIRANTFAIRGNHRWDHKDTQPKLLRTWAEADRIAKTALAAAEAEV